MAKKPTMGICLGHQLMALSHGGDTYKMAFGHRGANHPVKDMTTGRIYITSQNHGYAVDGKKLPEGRNSILPASTTAPWKDYDMKTASRYSFIRRLLLALGIAVICSRSFCP